MTMAREAIATPDVEHAPLGIEQIGRQAVVNATPPVAGGAFPERRSGPLVVGCGDPAVR